MERLEREPEVRWMPADLVQRDQAVVAIERGVLIAFRHHGRGELLVAHGEAQHLLAAQTSGWRGIEGENAVHEVEDARIGDATRALRRPYCPVDPLAIARRHAARA